jgi:hypothetical protein
MRKSIVFFYLDREPDHAARRISSIHNFSFRELERVHDYIQWLFPLVTRSNFNELAPLLTEEDRAAFHLDEVIRTNFRKSLDLMWEFFGFKPTDNAGLERTARWEERRDNWLTRDNHNLLRINRILRSSMLCGFTPEAKDFLDAALKAAAERPCIIGRSEEFWRTAVAAVPASPGA